MEALAALGVAAAAVQFFEFSKTLLKSIKELRDAKDDDFVPPVLEAARQLTDLKNAFQYQPGSNFHETKEVHEQQKALVELFSQCAIVAVELMDFLENIKPKPKEPKLKKIQHFLNAKGIMEKIRGFEGQINAYQSQLTIQLLAYMNAKFDASSFYHDAKLTELRDDQSKVMEVIALARERIINASVDNSSRVLAAVLKLTDGGTMMIAKDEGQIIGPKGQDWNKLHVLKLRSDPFEGRQVASIAEQAAMVTRPVLSRLKFRHARDRYDTVKQRYGKTLEWVFERNDGDLPWHPFPGWLKSDGTCYWINGKPGSGKTTLMKFISQDSRTKPFGLNCNNHKQGGNRVLQARFFFWNLGPSSLQKSQLGLLRALLHDILEQEPTLIPTIVPELCFDILGPNTPGEINEPTLPELQRWFGRLLQAACPARRLCFLIDGIDEYIGDLDDLTDVLLGKPSPFVKFIISSRPTIPCTDAFSRYPSLRLQDFSQGDIKDYAEEAFAKVSDSIKDLVDPKNLSTVIDDITKRCSGVFLWVELVVRSLIQGIKNGDNTDELLGRLQELPTDLTELYGQILDSIPSNYRSQAANLFRIMVQSVQYEFYREQPYPVSVLQLSFAEETYNATIGTEIKAMTANEVSRRCALMDRRIRSRCGGLLEVNDHPTTSSSYEDDDKFKQGNSRNKPGPVTRTPFVEFIHLSVVEFFTKTQSLEKLSPSTTNDLRASLFCSHIRILKSIRVDTSSPVPILDNDILQSSAIEALTDALDAENSGHPLQPELLNELDKTMNYHWNGKQVVHPYADQDYWVRMLVHAAPALFINWQEPLNVLIDVLDAFNFGGLAIFLPLPSYIETWLKIESFGMRRVGDVCTELLNAWALMKYKLAVHLAPQEKPKRITEDNSTQKGLLDLLLLPPWTPSNTRLVHILLEAGANPTQYIGKNPSAFHIFLGLILAYRVHDETSAIQMVRLLELFVSHGVTAYQAFPYSRLFQKWFMGTSPDVFWAYRVGIWNHLEYVKFIENQYKELAEKKEEVVNLDGLQAILLANKPTAMS